MGKADDTRQYIVEQAAPIFNRFGYAGTSMSQLTRAIRMTKGAIYGNFRNKDEIALAAFAHNFSMISTSIAKAVGKKDHACDKVIAFANYYLDHYAEIADQGGCPVLNAAVDSDNAHPPLKQAVRKAVDSWMQGLMRILVQGMETGEISRNTRPEQFASTFVSLIEGGLMLSKLTGNSIHLSRNVDHIIHLVNTELRV